MCTWQGAKRKTEVPFYQGVVWAWRSHRVSVCLKCEEAVRAFHRFSPVDRYIFDRYGRYASLTAVLRVAVPVDRAVLHCVACCG